MTGNFAPTESSLEVDGKLTGVRPTMRVVDSNDVPIGYIRDISGRSVLVRELSGSHVFWVPGENVATVVGNDVRLAPVRSALSHSAETIGL